MLALLLDVHGAGAVDATRYPTRPVTLVVGFAPGGESDRVARLIAANLEPALGQPVLVQNRPGAGGNVAASNIAHARPDGYTLFLGSMGPLAVAASLRNAPGFDAARDFAPITVVGTFDQVLVVHPSLPVRSLADFVGFARSHPGAVSYASTGVGSASHLAGLLLQRVAGIDLLHVPYQGALRISRDLLGGDVLASFAPAESIKPYVDAGQLRALARTGATRSRDWPALPTFAELGFPGFEVTDWYALVAPAGTPIRILDRWNREVGKVLSSPDVVRSLESIGMHAVPTSRAATASFFARERARWAKLLAPSPGHVAGAR